MVQLRVPARALPQDLGLLDDSLTVLQNMSPQAGGAGGIGGRNSAGGGVRAAGRTDGVAGGGRVDGAWGSDGGGVRAADGVGGGDGIGGRFTDVELRERLARLGFRGDRVRQVAGSLSGGERWRATLAALLLRGEPPQLLMLDEPTNNLDADSREFLREALAAYRGALIVVSHDERFLEEAGITRRLALG
jgi:hypothetical protein